MKNIDPSKIKELHNRLKKNIKEIGSTIIDPKEREIVKFSELINDNNLVFSDDSAKIIPLSYMMSLTNPVVQQILTHGGPELFSGLIKAFIHVGSEVEYIKPMLMNKKYKLRTELSEPVEKSGEKGSYCSISFIFSVLDENNDIHAIDNHICFYKL